MSELGINVSFDKAVNVVAWRCLCGQPITNVGELDDDEMAVATMQPEVHGEGMKR